MKLLPLDSPRWSRLGHAYGKAADTPDLIRRLEDEDRSGIWHSGDGTAWFEVHSSICHQGTIYPATFAAFPHIVNLALNGNDITFVKTIVLAGIIHRDGNLCGYAPKDLKHTYQQAMSLLQSSATKRLGKIKGIDPRNLHAVTWAYVAMRSPTAHMRMLRQIDNYRDRKWWLSLICQHCHHELHAEVTCSDEQIEIECEHLQSVHSFHYRPRTKPYSNAITRGKTFLDSSSAKWDNTQTCDALAATAAMLTLSSFASHILALRVPLACPTCEIPNRIIDWGWR